MQVARNTEAIPRGGREVRRPAAPRPPRGVTMATKQRLDVLVVDADEATTLELKDLLTEDGFQVHVLSDPAHAVEEVRRGRYQLVLLDVSPPAERGVDLLQQIRGVDSDLCVIAMTALPTVEVAVRTLKHQAFDYLQKPIAPEEMRAVVQLAVREKGLLVDIETRLNQVVGHRLRERRKALDLTLKQLANRTGLSVSLISQIELGKSAASMSTLHKLATALGIRMTYFFETI